MAREKDWYEHQRKRVLSRDRLREYMRKYRAELRKKVIGYYSEGKFECNCCLEKNICFLSIDHKNNDGAKHRREIKAVSGYLLNLWIKRNNFPPIFQILCFNCNLGRELQEDKVCPHKKVIY